MTTPPQSGTPYQGPPPPNYGNPSVPPPKKKSKTLWIILAVVGAVILVCCGIGLALALAGNNLDTTSAADKSTPSGAAPKTEQTKGEPKAEPKIGTPVRDGKFEFTVKSVKCGVSKVGGDFLNKKAQGQFCVVTITVKNIGKESQMFHDGNQVGFGASDVKYETDGTAGIYANEDGQGFLNEINPGNTATAKIVFDIPKDGKLLKLELHDSAFSGGVAVSLS